MAGQRVLGAGLNCSESIRGHSGPPTSNDRSTPRCCRETAAMQNFDPTHVGSGSIASDGSAVQVRGMSASRPKADNWMNAWLGPLCAKRPYSITSSARERKDSGIVRPSDLAVLRFTISSNLVGS
jgi:hypothetical protein